MLTDLELARRTPTGIQVRPTGLRLKWELTELTTADGHVARGYFSATARALSEPTELRMLDEALLGSRQVVMASDVAAYFADSILNAARKYARDTNAPELLGDERRKSILNVLMESASAVAFGCGIEILQPAQIDLDCPTLSRQRFEEMERQSAQKRAAEQVDHLRRSAELFQQFQTLRAAAPALSPGAILNQISPADRPDVFRAGLVASAQRRSSGTLWAASGNTLAAIDPTSPAEPRTFEVPIDLGPLRSVRPDGDGALLLGCRSGVIRFDPNSPSQFVAFRDPAATTQLGFNSAVILGNRLWAAHGEAGVVAWDFNAPSAPALAIRPSTAKFASFSPRNLAVLDANRLLLSTQNRLLIAAPNGELTAVADPMPSEIAAVFALPSCVVTVHSDGQVCMWSFKEGSSKEGSPAQFKLECRQRRTGKITAAALLPWLGDWRLLLATEEGPLVCLGLEDELISQYLGPYTGPRILAASDHAIAAVTSDRQRVVIWNAWDPKAPATDLYLYAQTHHRVADLIFV